MVSKQQNDLNKFKLEIKNLSLLLYYKLLLDEGK